VILIVDINRITLMQDYRINSCIHAMLYSFFNEKVLYLVWG